jgi:Protein of unknown function (DUF3617)
MKKSNLTLAIVICALPFAALAGQKINVKTGLWEMTMKMAMSGMPAIPPEALAKMPPEQRARIEAMTNGSGGGTTHTSQSCVTEKDLERGIDPQTDKQQNCKVVSSTVTSSSMEMHMACDGPQVKGTGVMKMAVSNREQVEGDMKMDMVSNGRPINMTTHISGKWLSADCGSVKPNSQD